MENADHIIDLGPEAGNNGGEVIVEGSYEDIKKSEKSITGKYLSHKYFIAIPKNTPKANQKILSINSAVGLLNTLVTCSIFSDLENSK